MSKPMYTLPDVIVILLGIRNMDFGDFKINLPNTYFSHIQEALSALEQNDTIEEMDSSYYRLL